MRINYVILVLSVFVSFKLLNTAEANEGLLILVKAYQHSGFNPSVIRTGVAEFEITRNRGGLIRSELFEDMQRKEEETIKERYKGDNAKIAIELKRVRDAHEESKRRVIQEKTKFLMSGNDRTFGSMPADQYKRRYERHEFVPSLNQWVFESIDVTFGTLLFSPDTTTKSQLYIHWIPNNRDLAITDKTVVFGEFQCFGRLQEENQSLVASIIRHKIDRKTFVLPADFQKFFESDAMVQSLRLRIHVIGDIDYDDGARAKIIEVKKGDKLLEKYHIDVDRGYLCPYQYVTNESGNTAQEKTAKGYIVEERTGLYYPTSYRDVMTLSMPDGVNKTDTEYRLVPDTLRLNHPVSDAEFAIDIPEDSRVTDFRVPDKTVRYVAVRNGTVSLAKGGYDFDKMPWLVREGEDYVPSTGGASGWMRWLLGCIGIVLILYALYRIWRKSH